ncbi:MAG: hypothetical protein V4584_11825 [Verrucomicrobiota bacterium]
MNHPQPADFRPAPRIKPPGKFITSLAIFLSGCGVVLVIGGFLMWMNGAFTFRTNDNLRPMLSPDRKLEAVLFRRTRENGDGYTTHVAIIKAGTKLPNRSGKAFIAEGEPAITVHWTDSTHLIIREPEGTRIILRASQLGEIKISEN